MPLSTFIPTLAPDRLLDTLNAHERPFEREHIFFFFSQPFKRVEEALSWNHEVAAAAGGDMPRCGLEGSALDGTIDAHGSGRRTHES